MIVLKKLSWDNCFSYGEGNSIDLEAHKLTQLLGTNGMGKSSIPIILEEALYNKNSKGIKKADIPNRFIGKGYHINLQFAVNDDEYEVDIDRKSSVKVKLFCNGEDISSHTATGTFATIEGVIGRPFKTTSQLIYQSTNSSLQFLTATDTNRKKFFIELFDLEVYVQLFDKFKEVAKELDKEVAIVKGKYDTTYTWLEKAQNENLEYVSVPDEIEADVEESRQELKSLEHQVSVAGARNKEVNRNNRYREQLDNFDITPITRANGLQEKSTSELTSEKGGLQQEINEADKTLKKLANLGEVCPSCLQPVDSDLHEEMVSEAESTKSTAKARLAEISKEVQEIEKQNKIVQEGKRKQRDLEELRRSVDFDMSTELTNVEKIKKQIAALEQSIQEKTTAAKKQRDKIAKANAHNTRVDTIKEQIQEHKKSVLELEKILVEKREELATLEILKKSFSTSGLVAYMIENLVKDLEQTANHYLAELSDGRFSLEFLVENDKLNVSLTDNGSEIEIQALSSGELARVNTATLLAIRKLMSSLSKANINALFLDEVISVLDSEGKEKLVEVLLEEPYLNSFLVSHNWEHPRLEKVEITKEDGISKLIGNG